ncbi:hypothetical protein [Rhizobium sp.]|uniref:hypothetical protein n=1 Tax=Rhizobium sp. TaxID=391 RepID=UPI003F7D5BC7
MEYLGMSLPGLCIEALPSGQTRVRVRAENDRTKKLTIPDGLAKEDFLEAYKAARQGIPTMTEYRPSNLALISGRPGFWATVYNMLARAKQRARKRGLEFDLATDDIIELLGKQDGRCAVSGMQFDIRRHPRKGAKRPFCMSIDRIDNSQGYIRTNVRITTVIVNTALLNWKQDDFRMMCLAVSRYPTCPMLVSSRDTISEIRG